MRNKQLENKPHAYETTKKERMQQTNRLGNLSRKAKWNGGGDSLNYFVSHEISPFSPDAASNIETIQ